MILAFRDYRKVQADLEGAQALLKDSDPELRDLAEEEVAEARGRRCPSATACSACCRRIPTTAATCSWRSVPAPVATRRRSSGDLFRMYSRYAERQGWRVETLSENEGEHGGYKEVIARVEGDNVYAKLVRVRRAPRSGCRKPNPRAGSTLPPALSRCCRSRTNRQRSRSTRPTCGWTPTVPPAPAASTSTRPTRRCASPTFPAASWSSARKSARSTRTAPRPWPGWRPSSTTSSRPRRAAGDRQHAQAAGGLGRPLGAHPYLQLPARAGHRPSHQPYPVLPGRGDGGRGGTGDRAVAAGIPGRSTGGPGRLI